MRTLGKDFAALVKAASSVVDNSYPLVELLVVYQGVDDEVFDKIKSEIHKIQKNREVIFIQNKTTNDERAKNLNLGLEKANGRYLAFVDDDDYVAKDHYDSLISVLKTSRAALSFNIAKLVNSRGQEVFFPFAGRLLDKISFIENSFITINSFVVDKKRIKKKYLKFNEAYILCEDYRFLLPIFLKYKSIYVPHQTSFYVVENEKSKSFEHYDGTSLKEEQDAMLDAYRSTLKLPFFERKRVKYNRKHGLTLKV